jgi:hypothetical protein
MKFKFYDKRVQNVVELIEADLKANGVKFNIYLEEHMSDGWEKCQGEYGEKELSVAVCRPLKKWFPILIHEYCHFLQEFNGCPHWEAATGKVDSTTVMWEYIGGERKKSQFVKNHIQKVKRMELACERRTHKMLSNFQFIKTQEEYAKEASAYIYFHDFIYETGKWYNKDKGKRSLDSKKIVKLMPSNLDGDYKEMPKGLYELFEECV